MMTKEQFLIFKSDMKAGMKIAGLRKAHRKAYWNEGFESMFQQNDAIKSVNETIKELTDSIKLKSAVKIWDHELYKYVEHIHTVVLGNDWSHHIAYYCAKHRLEEKDAVEYINSELSKMKWCNRPYGGNPERVYTELVKPIIEKYEKIVCAE